MTLLPFYINDCAIASLATGLKARSLMELRDRIETIPQGCIYFHFWIGRLKTSYEQREHYNDFAYWAYKALHDDVLAERLELLDPSTSNAEDLRSKLVELIEQRIDELELLPVAKKLEQFHFINSKIIVFKTSLIIEQPEDLPSILSKLSRSSLFYHFIDARRRGINSDDFSHWLNNFGYKYKPLIEQLRTIDPYFISLSDLQEKLVFITKTFFNKE